jgi:hypothetical protein
LENFVDHASCIFTTSFPSRNAKSHGPVILIVLDEVIDLIMKSISRVRTDINVRMLRNPRFHNQNCIPPWCTDAHYWGKRLV